MTTKTSLVDRLRSALSRIVRRPPDPERERQWNEHEQQLRREHDESVDDPVEGLRGMQPYDYRISKRD